MGNPDPNSIAAAYAAAKLRDHLEQVLRCVGLLSDEQLWFRPNQNSNSIANLLLHLRGNVGQWILGGLGRRPIERDRPAEFACRGNIAREDLLEPLRLDIEAACRLLADARPPDLEAEIIIQGYSVTGIQAVIHVVEHFAFHTGQIVTTTKWLLDVDLSLYDEHGHRRDAGRADVP